MMHGASEVWAGECGRRFGVESVEMRFGSEGRGEERRGGHAGCVQSGRWELEKSRIRVRRIGRVVSACNRGSSCIDFLRAEGMVYRRVACFFLLGTALLLLGAGRGMEGGARGEMGGEER